MGEILSQITRIDNNIQNALAKVAAKGVTVSADDGSDELPGLIEQISQAEDLDSVLDAQDALITELEAALEGKAAGGGSVETCTVTIAGQPETRYAYYSNGTEVVHYDSPLLPGDEFTVAKNSIIYIRTDATYDESAIGVTNGKILAVDEMGAHIIIAIYGDCTITL